MRTVQGGFLGDGELEVLRGAEKRQEDIRRAGGRFGFLGSGFIAFRPYAGGRFRL